MNCIYYQCTNLACKLRFPTKESVLDHLACPICRSPVSVVATAQVREETPKKMPMMANFHIEALLDNIRSAWNVGSIFRTSDGFGVKHLYLCGITPTPENRHVAKTSLGAEKSVEWTYIRNSIDMINELKTKNYFVIVLEENQNSKGNIYTAKLKFHRPVVVVFGNEICGTDPDIRELSDLILSIPMIGSKKSINVAVAFGIAVSLLKSNYLLG